MSGIRVVTEADRLPAGSVVLEEGVNPNGQAYVVWCTKLGSEWHDHPAIIVFCRLPGRVTQQPGIILNTEQLEAMIETAKG